VVAVGSSLQATFAKIATTMSNPLPILRTRVIVPAILPNLAILDVPARITLKRFPISSA